MASNNWLKKNWVLVAIALVGIGLFTGYISLPSGGTTAAIGGTQDGAAPGGILTGNPSIDITLIDSKTNAASAGGGAIVRALDSTGSLTALVTLGANSTGQLANLAGNTAYTLEVIPGTGTTQFYAFSTQVTTNAAGSKPTVLKYQSQNNGTQTITVYNNDDISNNAATVQTFAANEQINYRIRVRPAASTNDNNFFSDGVLSPTFVWDYNNQAVLQLSMKEGQTAMQSGSAPNGHAFADANRNATASFVGITKQLFPATNYDYYLSVKATTIEPTCISGTQVGAGSTCNLPTGTAGRSEIAGTFYDGCRVQNTQTGQYVEVYRDPVTLANICGTNIAIDLNYE